MPLIKLKYVGASGETGLTQNNVYVVLSLFDRSGDMHAIILDNNGNLYSTQELVTNTAKWTVEEVSYSGCVEL